MVLSGRPLALFLLGWSLVKVLARRALQPGSGLAQFERNYGGEGLAPLTADERMALSAFSQCIGCGRCDFGEGQRMARAGGSYPGWRQLVLASSRSMPDFDAAALAFEHVDDGPLEEKTARCPVAMPFAELAAFVRNYADRPHAAEQLGAPDWPALR